MGRLRRTTMILAMDGRFYNIQRGTMYATDSRDGSWVTSRRPAPGLTRQLGDFENVRWFIATRGYLWELDRDGTLFRGDANDHWTQVGKDHEFQGVRFLVALGSELYAIRDGTLYHITW